MAESFLAGKVAGADDAEVYQVVVHAGTGVLAGPRSGPGRRFRGNADRPGAGTGDPADPARCHVEDGPAISVSTAQMVACTAALSWMTHGDGGAVLALGRAAAAPAPRSAAPPANGTTAGAGSPGASPGGSTCTTSSTGSTAAAPTVERREGCSWNWPVRGAYRADGEPRRGGLAGGDTVPIAAPGPL